MLAIYQVLYQSSIRLTRLGFPYVERPRGQGLSFPLLTSYGSGAPICPAFCAALGQLALMTFAIRLAIQISALAWRVGNPGPCLIEMSSRGGHH